jgi:hypothetical protein
MNEFTELLAAFQRLPLDVGIGASDIVSLHQKIPTWAAGPIAVAGLMTCLFGSRKTAFRVVLAVPMALLGWKFGPQLAEAVHLAPAQAGHGASGVLGLLSLACPAAIFFLAGGVGGALLGAELVEKSDYLMGAVPGFVLAGTLAAFASRFLAILVSGIVGAACLSLGTVTLLSTTRLAGLVLGFPSIVVAAACCIVVGSIAYQLKFAPSEEEIARKRAEQARQRELLRDSRDREKRFKQYGKGAKS